LKHARFALAIWVIILSLMLAPGVKAMPVTVQITPPTQAIPQGTAASYTVGLLGAPLTTDGYDLTLSGLVPGAAYSLSSRVATPAGSGTTSLTIDASSTPLFCPGTYPFTVTATNSTTGDTGSASGSLTVLLVGPPISITITTDKSTYRIGDTVTIQMSANRPAEARLTISTPSGSTSVFYYVFYGPSYALTKTLTANTLGRYTLTFEADDFCNGYSSATTNFEVTPNTYEVSISIDGVPTQISIPLTVDGQSQGSMSGSEIKNLSFKLDTSHTISVAQSVNGDAGVRYTISQNTWTVNSAGSHTFQYATEYLFTVATDPDGVTPVTGGGWFKSGTSVQTSQAPDSVAGPPGTKYVFKGWTVDGVPQTGNPISLTMDKAHKVVATYETQYQLLVDSAYGNPTGSGYYPASSTATFSVTTPVGFLIQQVFAGWTGDYTGNSPTASITMDKPHTVHANWQTSYFQLEILAVAVAAIIIVAAFLLMRRRRPQVPIETKPTPPMTAEEGVGETPPPPSVESVKCASCGADVAAGQAYCQNCGSKIE
jgi:uncharacterized repeat protein (TIGR02543 family)